jgi:uncharacterized protein
MNHSASYWIDHLHLKKHPEGGYYREVYRSPLILDRTNLPGEFTINPPASTSIYYLLEKKDVSHLHRLKADEIWHAYEGESLFIFSIDPNGNAFQEKLGNLPERGDNMQVLVPAGRWYGAYLESGRGYALVGCTVAPGFTFADFELGERATLLNKFPSHSDMIKKLTKKIRVD